MSTLLDEVRVQILASRAAREAQIRLLRNEAMQMLEQASQEEVILFRQLMCDVQGTHIFETVDGHQACRACGWTSGLPSPWMDN